jgi:hypothetical protein
LKPKKRRKVQIDLNDRFTSIEEIIKAKEAVGKMMIEPEVANALNYEDQCFV